MDNRFTFNVNDYAFAPYTKLKLYNGFNETVAEGFGKIETSVPSGLYTLRIEMNEFVEDRPYRISNDTTDSIDKIVTASSMPSRGFSNTHEYFSSPASHNSRTSTVSNLQISGSSVFIFLTYNDANIAFNPRQTAIKGFTILNSEREIAIVLGEENIKCDWGGGSGNFFGTAAFSMELPAGQYYVQYRNKKIGREFPLYVFDGWQSQVFMMCAEIPLFASMKISMARNGFDYDNPSNIHLDALIQRLHNGVYMLPPDLLNMVAYGKWENPMLAILGAYMYLQSDQNKEDRLFQMILDNLESQILGTAHSPDILALRLLGAIHFGTPIPKTSLDAPCMIMSGLQAFLRQSLKDEKLLKRGSIADKTITKLSAESIWTIYKPLYIRRPRLNSSFFENESIIPELHSKSSVAAMKSLHIEENRLLPDKPKIDWIICGIFNQLENGYESLNHMAEDLQLTKNVVKTTLRSLNKDDKLERVSKAITGSTENVVAKSMVINDLLKQK